MSAVDFQIIRTKRKTVALEVAADARLIVRAPLKTPVSYLERLVERKMPWIRAKQEMVRKYRPVQFENMAIDRENLPYLGSSFKLETADGADDKDLREWYREQAAKVIKERVQWYSQAAGIPYKSVKISNARRRWGSCGPDGSLNFTWRLVMAPLQVIDYVAVHELVHINVKNHSKAFWSRVRAIIPDCADRRKWLRENRCLMDFL